mgnify:CR=1 FL=1
MIRSLALAIIIGLIMAGIYVLPPFKQVDSAINMTIPTYLGSWQTESYAASDKELSTLAPDTKFSKAKCGLRRVEEMSYITGQAPIDVADLSVVLSGYDLANSIHRPERCMPAQGHRGLVTSTSTLDLGDGRSLPLTRIVSKRDFAFGPADDRKHVTLDSITYYFFVGAERITADHTKRTLIDIVDRIAKGEAQKWAFISATMSYQENPAREFGTAPDLEMADKKIRQLLKELAEHNIDWSRVSL